MKIGFLHSVKLHLGNIANAKMYRIMYEDWKANIFHWRQYYYGQNTNRAKLRGLIYNYRSYSDEFKDLEDYNLIFLSLNFDIYPKEDFHRFVYHIINDLYSYYPILHSKEVIIGAGNEVQEKRQSAEKVFETCWDTAQGIKNSVKPDLPICAWNQKVRTTAEREAFQQLCKSALMKSTCKYMGIQSLDTSEYRLSWAINGAKLEGYEPIDVELGTTTTDFKTIKNLFEIDRINGVKKVFILTPYISRQLADYDENFKKYALSIENQRKDKFLLLDYVQQFKTFIKGEQEEVMNKMLDEAIMGTIYKYGTRGFIVKLIQKCLNEFIKYGGTEGIPLLVEDGKYGSKTKDMVILYQEASGNLGVDGVVGRNTMRSLINYFLFLGK